MCQYCESWEHRSGPIPFHRGCLDKINKRLAPRKIKMVSAYVKNYIKAEYECLKCGHVWMATPSNVLCHGNGCPGCPGKHSSLKKTIEQFIEQAIKVHSSYYGYRKSKYINDGTKLEIICPAHGPFWQTPNHHLMGRGCPSCSSGFNPSKEAIVYYIRINCEQGTFYKIWISNNDVMERYSGTGAYHNNIDVRHQITVIKEWHYKNGADAKEREQDVINEHWADLAINLQGFHGIPGFGSTEIFTHDVLGLDDKPQQGSHPSSKSL